MKETSKAVQIQEINEEQGILAEIGVRTGWVINMPDERIDIRNISEEGSRKERPSGGWKDIRFGGGWNDKYRDIGSR
jgi:hypothetical protein